MSRLPLAPMEGGEEGEMKKRLNDTVALLGVPTRSEQGEHHSVSTEKIDNGYLVRQSRCDPKTGEYSSTTHFCETPPKIIPARVSRRGAAADSKSSLRDAMDYMK